MMNDDDIVP